jgi:transposase
VLVRDGYAGYDHLTTAVHAECGAHLLRALKGVHDADPAGQSWAEAMTNTLLLAKDMMAAAAKAGQASLEPGQVSFIRSAYAGALALGREANAAHPGSKAAKLVNRFARDAEDVLRHPALLPVDCDQARSRSPGSARRPVHHRSVAATKPGNCLKLNTYPATRSGPPPSNAR